MEEFTPEERLPGGILLTVTPPSPDRERVAEAAERIGWAKIAEVAEQIVQTEQVMRDIDNGQGRPDENVAMGLGADVPLPAYPPPRTYAVMLDGGFQSEILIAVSWSIGQDGFTHFYRDGQSIKAISTNRVLSITEISPA